jgi:hypothetical protein
MARRVFCIAGFGPGLRWKRNVGRKRRTIAEALAIAQQNGVQIPDDVEFFEAQPAELKGSWKEWFDDGKKWETARGPRVKERRDGYVYWNDHYDPQTKTIRFWVHPDILTSDEGIVAVLTHEVYELSEIREACMYNRWRMEAYDYAHQVADNQKGNFHYEAWEVADKAVEQMREAKK